MRHPFFDPCSLLCSGNSSACSPHLRRLWFSLRTVYRIATAMLTFRSDQRFRESSAYHAGAACRRQHYSSSAKSFSRSLQDNGLSRARSRVSYRFLSCVLGYWANFRRTCNEEMKGSFLSCITPFVIYPFNLKTMYIELPSQLSRRCDEVSRWWRNVKALYSNFFWHRRQQ